MREPYLPGPLNDMHRWLQFGLETIHGRKVVKNYLLQHAQLVDSQRPIILWCVGKAAAAMALGALDCFPESCIDQQRSMCIGHHSRPDTPGFPHWLRWHKGNHPLPNQSSLDAGAALFAAAKDLSANDKVLVLLSGGASALVEVLHSALSLAQWQEINRQLLSHDTPIAIINALRRCGSLLKGGGLAAQAAPAKIITLAISDVSDDDPTVIGSGPTVATALPSRQQVREWCQNFSLPFPAEIIEQLAEQPASEITISPQHRSTFHLIASNDYLRQQIMLQAQASDAIIHDHFRLLDGSLPQVTQRLKATLTVLKPGHYALCGGELTLDLPAQTGQGGRLQHLCLSLSIWCAKHGLWILAAASDGLDGSGAGGAWIGPICPFSPSHINKALTTANSRGLLATNDQLLPPLLTGSNVNDVLLAFRPSN